MLFLSLKFQTQSTSNFIMMLVGTYSWPGSIGPASCFTYFNDFDAKGAAFVMGISVNSTTQYLTALSSASHSAVPVLGTANYNDSVRLVYDNSTLQIRSLALNLCLDDGGFEALGGQNRSALVTFQPCDSQSPNQQFILNSQRQILNPNWPNNNICVSGNGNQVAGHNQLILWECATGDSTEVFFVYYFYCPSKFFLSSNYR